MKRRILSGLSFFPLRRTTAFLPQSQPRARAVCALCAALLAGAISNPSAQAQSTWSFAGAGNLTWENAGSWNLATVPDGAGSIVTVFYNASGTKNVTIGASHTVGSLSAGRGGSAASRMYLFQGTGVLTLDNTGFPGKPYVGQPSNYGYQEYPVVFAGTQGVRFGGGATAVISGNNTFSGDVEFNRSLTRINHTNALPHGARTGNVTFVNSGNGFGTLDLGVSITINGLSSPAGGVVTVSTVGASRTLTVGDNNQGGNFGGVLQDGNGVLSLTKIGAGTLQLSGTNTYSGATTVLGGTLQLSGGSISGASSLTVGPGASLDVTGAASAVHVGSTLTGAGATGTIIGDLTLDSGASFVLAYVKGTPTLTVAGNLALNGNTTVINITGSPLGDGSYKLVSKSGIGQVSGTSGSVTIGGAGIVGGGSAVLEISGGELYLNISGGATIAEWGSGNGTWAVGVSGWNSGGATVFENGYAALFSDAYSTGNPTITLNSEVLPQLVLVSSTNHYTIAGSGDIGGSAELRKLGAGTLTLDVANSHTGGSALFAGTLNLKNAAALGAASGTFTINGGTIDNTAGIPLTIPDYPQVWNGDFAFAGSSDLHLGGGPVTLGSSRTVTIGASTLTVGGAVTGTGASFVKAGAGSLVLAGSLALTSGGLTVNGGALTLGADSALDSGIAVINGGTLTLNGNNSISGGIALNKGEIIVNNPGALNASAPNAITIPDNADSKILTLNGNNVGISGLSQSGVVAPTAAVIRNHSATTAATLRVSISGTATFVGQVVDGGAASLAVTKEGGGTLTFGAGGVGTGNYTYSGDTIISGGTLSAGANNVLPHGAGKGNLFIGAGTSFDLVNRTITINGLYGGGRVTHSANNNGGVLQVGDGDASGSFSGVLQDGAAISPFVGLTKIGGGTQSLSGTNTYSGPTLVSAGTLLVNRPGSLAAASAVTVGPGATLGGSGTINGNVAVSSGGTLGAGSNTKLLTIASGLTLDSGATNVWQLAANTVFNADGTNFDQVVLSGGNLGINAGAVLALRFTGAATIPNLANSFWQYPRQWKVLAVTGGASNPGLANFSVIDGTNGITAGTFTTASDGTGVTLEYTPSVAPPDPTPATTVRLVPGTGTDYTVNYSGGTGSQFVLITTTNLADLLPFWTRVETNLAANGSFAVPTGTNPQGFYRVISE